MNVVQACEAYNNTIAAVSLDGQWLTVKTLKAPDKIIEAASPHGYYPTHTQTQTSRGTTPNTPSPSASGNTQTSQHPVPTILGCKFKYKRSGHQATNRHPTQHDFEL
jgi:hypothetical protein